MSQLPLGKRKIDGKIYKVAHSNKIFLTKSQANKKIARWKKLNKKKKMGIIHRWRLHKFRTGKYWLFHRTELEGGGYTR